MENDLEVVEYEHNEEEAYKLIHETISNECHTYLDDLFAHEKSLALNHDTFIKTHNLFIPHKNYIQAEFLFDKIYKVLQSNDAHFASKTTIRLYHDITKLKRAKREFDKKLNEQKQIFQKLFSYHSNVSYIITSDINLFKTKKSSSPIIQNEIKILKKIKKELHYHYYEIFTEIFFQKTLFLHHTLLKVLNCYLAYFELFMWEDAKKSSVIMQKFSLLHIPDLSTKAFLEYYLHNMPPYSQEYKNLQAIYRSYL